jgi:tRNA(Ile)-lysidine synthase
MFTVANLTSVITCFMQVIQQRRVGGAEESFALKDLSALDPCDKHRDEGGEGALKSVLR